MISKSQIKFINNLKKKKYRDKYQMFIAEGEKTLKELLSASYEIHSVYAIKRWLEEHAAEVEQLKRNSPAGKGQKGLKNICAVVEVKLRELKKISSLKTPVAVLGVCRIPASGVEMSELKGVLTIVLDDIQDPGNLGTIIRISKWFGVKNIICSHGCADAYSPKAVQASMGAINGVHLHYTDLAGFISKTAEQHNINVYGTFPDGGNIISEPLPDSGIIVIGNESRGISSSLLPLIRHRISIPSWGAVDSLNAAVATALICWEFRRRSTGEKKWPYIKTG